MKIAILREGKIPPDKRVPLLPAQCLTLQNMYPQLSFLIQSSAVRCVEDAEYEALGLTVCEDVSEADIFFGVKEVQVDSLVSDKTYFFFSHTIKKQPYNRNLLRTILQKNIQLLDYECLTNLNGERVVAFGRFAGLVGAYNALRLYGIRYEAFVLKPAYECRDLVELAQEFKKVQLPALKIAITSIGRVGKGAKEILDLAGIKQVSTEDYLTKEFSEVVYVCLRSKDYIKEKTDEAQSFYKNPSAYESDFQKFYQVTDMLITAHFWDVRGPALFEKEEAKRSDFKIKIIADITCDVKGSIPITLRTSTITEPFYDYNPTTEQAEKAFNDDGNITIMAVDNLPSELPLDASRSFGEQLMLQVFPALLEGDTHDVLKKATVTESGHLTPKFDYLTDFVGL
jgi:alanine dehydrogenase